MIRSRSVACITMSMAVIILVILVPKLLFGNAPTRNSVSRLATKQSFGEVRSQTGVWERGVRGVESATAGHIDALFDQLLSHDASPPALVKDEQFIRRVYLDLTGKLPGPDEVR